MECCVLCDAWWFVCCLFVVLRGLSRGVGYVLLLRVRWLFFVVCYSSGVVFVRCVGDVFSCVLCGGCHAMCVVRCLSLAVVCRGLLVILRLLFVVCCVLVDISWLCWRLCWLCCVLLFVVCSVVVVGRVVCSVVCCVAVYV